MHIVPMRLEPGQDLRDVLGTVLSLHQAEAGFVMQGIGSLSVVSLRLAGAKTSQSLQGDFEILTLAGSLGTNGVHLHMSVADAQGKVIGGHLLPGNVVRTTAEIMVALLPDHQFTRVADPVTGFAELHIDPDA